MAFDITSYILGKKSGGGGNPNTRGEWSIKFSDISKGSDGTPAPYDLNELFNASSEIDMTIFASIDASALGAPSAYGCLFADFDNNIFLVSGYDASSDSGFFVAWAKTGPLVSAYMLMNGTKTDISQYASVIGLGIDIIYHPMPE